jgi:hypothetical protein
VFLLSLANYTSIVYIVMLVSSVVYQICSWSNTDYIECFGRQAGFERNLPPSQQTHYNMTYNVSSYMLNIAGISCINLRTILMITPDHQPYYLLLWPWSKCLWLIDDWCTVVSSCRVFLCAPGTYSRHSQPGHTCTDTPPGRLRGVTCSRQPPHWLLSWGQTGGPCFPGCLCHATSCACSAWNRFPLSHCWMHTFL